MKGGAAVWRGSNGAPRVEVTVVRDGPGWWAGRCAGAPGVFVVGRRRAEVEELVRGLVAGLGVQGDEGAAGGERGRN